MSLFIVVAQFHQLLLFRIILIKINYSQRREEEESISSISQWS